MINKYISFLVLGLLIISCSDSTGGIDELPPEDDFSHQGTALTKFYFQASKNSGIAADKELTIDNFNVTGRLPYEADIQRLVASFEHSGATASIDGVVQTSDATFNDFTDVLPYKIETGDGRSAFYNVDITHFTGLPVIEIETEGNAPIDSKEDYVYGTVSIKGGRNTSSFTKSEMKIKGRGNSTWFIHPKKPYQMKFSEKTSILDMPEDKKWVFLAEYSDKSLLRNRISFEMGYLSSLDYTPQCTFAEVFVNGSYSGTYNIAQKAEESDNRVVLGDTGYLLEIDQYDRLDWDDVYFNTNDFLINIKEPELTYESTAYQLVKDHMIEFEEVLHGPNFKDENLGYQKYIDVDSFIDWFLISEIVKNQDSRSFSSIFLNYIPGEKIKMGPLWDFDLSFGNVNYSECTNPTGFWVKYHTWYARLFEDPFFVEKVKERFSYYRGKQDFILAKIDELANYLKWSQQENNDRWDLFGNYVWPNPVYYNTHQEEVDHLKSWYNERMDWLNEEFNKM